MDFDNGVFRDLYAKAGTHRFGVIDVGTAPPATSIGCECRSGTDAMENVTLLVKFLQRLVVAQVVIALVMDLTVWV